MSMPFRAALLVGTALIISFSAHSKAATTPQVSVAKSTAVVSTPKKVKKVTLTPLKTESITVHGQAGTAATAMAEQRNSIGVASVLSREQIERAPQTNLSDVLTRLPGLSAYSNMNQGQAATGENQYVTIRGLDSSYNAYTLNGERATGADPSTRAVSFDMLAPYGITAIKVTKSTTADMDGDAIGGAIDIRTPTAFDFNGPYRKITVQGQLADLAAGIGTSDLGGNVEAEFAQKFGKDKRFGIYVSGYYLDKDVAGKAVSPNAAYVPTLASQADLPIGQASQLSSQTLKYDVYTTNIKRYGGSLSLNYEGDHQTFYFLGTYGQYNTKENDNQVSAIGDGSGYNANGTYESTYAYRGQYFETDDSAQLLTNQKLGGTTDVGRWHFAYDIFNSYSEQNSPNQVEASMYGSTAGVGSTTFSEANTTLPHIVAPSSVLSNVYDQNTDRFWKTQGRDAGSLSDMYGIHADASYKFHSHILDALDFGFKISQNARQSYEHPFFHDDNNFVYDGPYFGGEEYGASDAAGPTVGAIPGKQTSAFNSQVGEFRLLDRSWVESQATPYKYQNDPNGTGNYTKNDWNANTTHETETIYAGYVQLHLHAGPVQIVPGFRYEWTNFSGNHWVSNGDDATGSFTKIGQSYGMPLPMLNVNWRPTNLSVIRLAVRRSFTRPAFGLLNGATSISLNPFTNQILSVSQPNPNLKPTTATTVDLAGELYNHHAGVVSASLYYKDLDKFIFTSVSGTANSSTLGGNVPTNSYTANGTLYSMPENGGHASIEGMELNTEQRLYFLPSFLSGFGINANITLQHSTAASNISGHANTSLPRAPNLLFNTGVFYAGRNTRIDLNYNYTGRQLLSLNSSGPDFYLQPIGRLDLTMRYHFRMGLDLSLAMQNLNNAPAFYETEGKSKRYLAYDSSANGAYVQTGRTFLAGASMQF